MNELPSMHRQIAEDSLRVAQSAISIIEESSSRLVDTESIQDFRELSGWPLEDIQALWRRQGAKFVEVPLSTYGDKDLLIEHIIAVREKNLA
jgi:hypothetical protein